MAKAKAILKRRTSVQNTRRITKTMAMVATVKFQQSSQRLSGTVAYRRKIEEILRDLAHEGADVPHSLLDVREPRKVAHLVITSNRGLCGSYNANLVRKVSAAIERDRGAGLETELHVVGKKGASYLRAQGAPVAQVHDGLSDPPKYDRILELANTFIDRYDDQAIDRLTITYQHIESMSRQYPTSDQVLPVAPPKSAGGEGYGGVHYLFEPDRDTLLKTILPLYMKVSFFSRFQESDVGEHFARMVAMNNATDAADDMIKLLSRWYNRARQTQITSEICELMGGVEALK